MEKAEIPNREGLNKRIGEMEVELRELFMKRDTVTMYEAFREDLILFAPTGRICQGKDGFGRFFDGIGEVKDVTIKTANVYVSPLSGKEFTHVAFVIVEYSISHNPNGTNGSGIYFCRHIEGCEWDRR